MATILSDLLNAIRIGRSDWAIIELGAPGGLQFKRDDRAYVHFVLDGSVMLAHLDAVVDTNPRIAHSTYRETSNQSLPAKWR